MTENTANTAHITTQGSTALDGVGTNPTGKKLDENTARVDPHKGSTALDSVGVVPENIQNIQENPAQPKNTTEYVTGAISNAYTTAKETLLGTFQSASTAKPQDQNIGDKK